MITYRKMTDADIPAGLALCRSAGWNQLESDWKVFIEQSTYGNKVAVNDDSGQVVGTVATITYDDHFSWIGMVLVDPSMKRQGIGTQLLRESFALLGNQETIKLDATPAGREIYLKLGFVDEYALSRMVLAANGTKKNKNINQNNFNSILNTDKSVFGASRSALLRWYYESFPELAFIKHENAYCFGRRGHKFTQIGPVVADNIEDAIELVSASLKNIEGEVALDVMDNSLFQKWLLSIGFIEQRNLIRMYRGKNEHPGTPEKQFAILGPEFG